MCGLAWLEEGAGRTGEVGLPGQAEEVRPQVRPSQLHHQHPSIRLIMDDMELIVRS